MKVRLGLAFALDVGNDWRSEKRTVLPLTDIFHLKVRLVEAQSHFLGLRSFIRLYSVEFFVVTAVHVFDDRLVISETSNKWRPVERRLCGGRD